MADQTGAEPGSVSSSRGLGVKTRKSDVCLDTRERLKVFVDGEDVFPEQRTEKLSGSVHRNENPSVCHQL